MWQEFKISECTYFMHCSFMADKVECLLYDLNESWCEVLQQQELLKRVKLLNKRIQFDEARLCSTLENEQPTAATWNAGSGDGGDATSQRTLKLTYRVGTCPFKFEWHLRAQQKEEFKKTMLTPLFSVLHGMSQQVLDLREAVRKRDIELQQYRMEGAILRRTTVATQLFDFAQFDGKYAHTKTWSEGVEKLLAHLSASVAEVTDAKAVKPIEKKELKTDMKAEDGTVSPTTTTNKKISPRNKKRRALEGQQRHMERMVTVRKRKLEYQNSQTLSQTLESQSSNECQAAAAVETLNTLECKRQRQHEETNEEDVMPSLSTADETSDEETVVAPHHSPKKGVISEEKSVTIAQETISPESKISKEVDAIFEQLKELERRRIADMKSRTERVSRTRSKH